MPIHMAASISEYGGNNRVQLNIHNDLSRVLGVLTAHQRKQLSAPFRLPFATLTGSHSGLGAIGDEQGQTAAVSRLMPTRYIGVGQRLRDYEEETVVTLEI
jgi:hypothetical protein